MKAIKFDIPVNFTIHAKDEREAEMFLLNFLKDSDRMYGRDYFIHDFEFIEFIPEKTLHSCCDATS